MNDVRVINDLVQRESAFVEPILHELRKVIVGQDAMIERLLIGLLTGGHVLVEGVPGLAKTLTVKTLCDTISAKFSRVQFTPDLLPADLVGTVIYNQQRGEFSAKKGPIFANLVLADEINRAPAKVQSALLEAMQEQQVTIGDTTYPLEQPFMVMATQNPIEQEGTYPLPEAQVDRFMLHVKVGYPDREQERQIMERVSETTLREGHGTASLTHASFLKVAAVVEPRTLLGARRTLAEIYMDPKIKDYIVDIILATRAPEAIGLKDLKNMIAHGASPRATIALNLAARGHAFLRHRGYITPDDIKAVAPDVVRHRVLRTYEAEAEEISSDDIVRRVLDTVEVP